MRISIAALCAGTIAGLLVTSTANAQTPRGPKRYSSSYGGMGMGMGGMGMGGMGMGMMPRRRSAPKPTTKPPAAPNRYSPSGGGAAAGGISAPSGRSGTPRRQLRRNRTPVISPYLNLDPSYVASDAGQFFSRVLPQQEFNRTQQQTQQAISSLQNEISEQDLEIQTGLSTTGHKTSFMNYGSYFPN